MRRALTAATVAILLLVPVYASNVGASEPEGCQAFNPGQPSCTYKVTHEAESDVTGAAGFGSWVVKIKRGKRTETIKSPASGEPAAITYEYRKGDKVTAKALSPGSVVIAGHVQ